MNTDVDFTLKDIKLVIWDLDDTFWNGTISEGKIEYNSFHLKLVKDLTDKGIINSICSKNDFETVKNEFKSSGLTEIWDYFVFSSINWEPKGQRIKQIIQDMNLREQNVLFLDDNLMNLKETLFYCPKIKTALPQVTRNLALQLEQIEKTDLQHSRLKQYKILEIKNSKRKETSSNEEFLFESNIIVEMKDDCLDEIERIHELINRSNQLNYTKKRDDKDELYSILQNEDLESKYITARDNYGDYGIVGFYTLDKNNNKLVHFLFSCRTLGMEIEQYVYSILNYPELKVQGEVIHDVVKDKKINWINQLNPEVASLDKSSDNDIKSFKILLKGPCDLDSTFPYLKSNFDLCTEFIHTNHNAPPTLGRESSLNIVNSKKLSKNDIKEVLANAPFINEEDFEQSLYDEKYNFIIYSLLIDDVTGIYRQKKTGVLIPFGHGNIPFTDEKNQDEFLTGMYKNDFAWTVENLQKFREEYEFLGFLTSEQIIENLKFIFDNTDKDVKWILILGSEIEPGTTTRPFKNMYKRHRDLNSKVTDFVKSFPNVEIINLTNLVETKQNYTDNENHFKRSVYFKLAKEIVDCVNRMSGENIVKTETLSIINQCVKDFIKKLSDMLSFVFSVKNKYDSNGGKFGKRIVILGHSIDIKN